MSSETPTDGRCNAKTRDGGHCANYPVDGSDRCRMHGGNAGAPEGEANGSYDHGAFSEHWRSDLTDAEAEALDALVDHLQSIDDERTLAAEVAAEALLKYKRSADSRFLREARQWFDDFNLLPNADEIEMSGDGTNPLNVVVSREAYDDE